MAASNHSRGARLRARLGANRPRTHPSATPEAERRGGTPGYLHDQHPAERRRVLSDVRDQLAIAAASAVVCGAALAAQAADHDKDVVVILRRCVGDILARQISVLESLITGCPS